MDLCSPLPDLSLSVSRMGEALFTHYKKFFGILREFNHETNFELSSTYLSKLMLIKLPTRNIKWKKKSKTRIKKTFCTQPFNFESRCQYLQRAFGTIYRNVGHHILSISDDSADIRIC